MVRPGHAWQQVRDGAVALQQDTSPAGELQRAIFADQTMLRDGRYEVLRLGAEDEDEDDAEGAGAEVDTPDFQFSKKECRLQLAGQQEDWGKEAQAQSRVEEVLAAYYFSEEGVESRTGGGVGGRRLAVACGLGQLP